MMRANHSLKCKVVGLVKSQSATSQYSIWDPEFQKLVPYFVCDRCGAKVPNRFYVGGNIARRLGHTCVQARSQSEADSCPTCLQFKKLVDKAQELGNGSCGTRARNELLRLKECSEKGTCAYCGKSFQETRTSPTQTFCDNACRAAYDEETFGSDESDQ